MLEEGEIEGIKKLINQGKPDYQIGLILSHSANTIKKIRGEYKDAKADYATGEETHFDDPIEEVRGITHNIDNLLKKWYLKAGERTEWEKRLEKIREVLRTEADDKVAKEKSKALNERDNFWVEHIEKNYVQKEVVTDLNRMVKAGEATIESLKDTIDQKDGILASIQLENLNLKNRISDLQWENNGLNEKNLRLHYHIENRLDTDVRQWQEKLMSDQNAPDVEKTNFDRHVEVQQATLDKLCFEANEKQKDVEIREGKLIEQEKILKKREAELDKNTKIMNNTLDESIKAIEKRERNVTDLEKGLKRWYDEQKDELDAERKKIKDDQEKITREHAAIEKKGEELKTWEQRLQERQKLLNYTSGFNKFSSQCPHSEKPKLLDANNQEINQKTSQTSGKHTHPENKPKSEQRKPAILRPVSISGEPVSQHCSSPIFQYLGEPILVQLSGTPMVQSGCSPVYHSGINVSNKN